MSDKMKVDVNSKPIGLQDTGNPVLDSVINLYVGAGVFPPSIEVMNTLHKALSELAGKEPGGLFRRRDCFRVSLGDKEEAVDAPFIG
jgi:hypothetical protein